MLFRVIVGIGLCLQPCFGSSDVRHGQSSKLRVHGAASMEQQRRSATGTTFCTAVPESVGTSWAWTVAYIAGLLDKLLRDAGDGDTVELNCIAGGPSAILMMLLLRHFGIDETGIATKRQADTIVRSLHFLAQTFDLSNSEKSATLKDMSETWSLARRFEHGLRLANDMPKEWLELEVNNIGIAEANLSTFDLKLVTDVPKLGTNATTIEKDHLGSVEQDIASAVKQLTESFLRESTSISFEALLEGVAPRDGIITTASVTLDAQHAAHTNGKNSRVLALMSRNTASSILQSTTYRSNPNYLIAVVDRIKPMLLLTTTVEQMPKSYSLSDLGVVAFYDPTITDVEPPSLSNVRDKDPFCTILGGTVDAEVSMPMLEHYQEGLSASRVVSMLERSQEGKCLAEIGPKNKILFFLVPAAAAFAPTGGFSPHLARLNGAKAASQAVPALAAMKQPQDPPAEWQVQVSRHVPGDPGQQPVAKWFTRMFKGCSLVASAPVLVGGLAAGRCLEKLTGESALQSKPFSLGLKAFMAMNGISPRVEFRPVSPELLQELADFYTSSSKSSSKVLPEELSATDLSLTPFLVPNHQSWLDMLITGQMFVEQGKKLKVVAMEGVKNIPGFETMKNDVEAILVDRDDAKSKKQCLRAMLTHARAWKPGDTPCLIFPEGRIANNKDLAPFSVGAFFARQPVRPMVILYTGKGDILNTVWRRMTPQGEAEEFNPEHWVDEFFSNFVHSMRIVVLPPILPEAGEKAEDFAERVQRVMQEELTALRESEGLP